MPWLRHSFSLFFLFFFFYDVPVFLCLSILHLAVFSTELLGEIPQRDSQADRRVCRIDCVRSISISLSIVERGIFARTDRRSWLSMPWAYEWNKGCRAIRHELFMPEIERLSDATSARVTSFSIVAQCHFCAGSSRMFRNLADGNREEKKKRKEKQTV